MFLRLALLVFLPAAVAAQQMDHSEHEMTVGTTGVVMNENRDTLPRGCTEVSRDHSFTIYAGREYADQQHGMMFGMSEHEVQVEPCSRVEITFVNEDGIRHQWMVHGLPKYLYPAGMFHIEAMGEQTQKGVFIVPPEDKTYLIHCDMAQHMEKGMRGQLVVGKGSGDLWSVPGISDDYYRFPYLSARSAYVAVFLALAGFLATFWLAGKRK
ncbi:MAG: copper oxidase [Gammaproteobacteria bacterium]|nr:MAG: copper oxidase [Gammaproteobacteria bacterium]RLA31817.1 MAG: copper oxidase [Gammaproteobacteria bacterium]